jgi:hypothetical protein
VLSVVKKCDGLSGLLGGLSWEESLGRKVEYCRGCGVELKRGKGVRFRNGVYCVDCAKVRKLKARESFKG